MTITTTTTTTTRRFATFAAAAGFAVTAAAVGSPAMAVDDEPTKDRPCFMAQPRWNTSPDGPAPSCPTPSWRQVQAESGWGTPGSSAGAAPRRNVASAPSDDVATLADCLDPGRRPPVRTCPYPIKSGDQFSHHVIFTR